MSAVTAPRVRAWARATLRMKALAAVAMPVLALLLAMAAIIIVRHLAVQAAEDSEQALQGQVPLDGAIVMVLDAEAGLHGYRSVGQPNLLEPVERMTSRLPDAMARLERTLADDPVQRRRVAQVRSLVDEEAAAVAELRAAPRSARSQLVGESARRVDRLAELLSQLRLRERQVQEAQSASADQLRTALTAISIGSGVLGLAGGLVAMWLLAGGISRRVQLVEENARRLDTGEPLAFLPNGDDEIARLARTMHLTAAAIQEKRVMIEMALEAGGLILFEVTANGEVELRGDSELLRQLGLTDYLSGHHASELRQLLSLPEEANAATSGGDLVVRDIDGLERSLSVQSREVVAPSGEGTGVTVGVIRDVTAQVGTRRSIEAARDAAQQASRAKDEFLSRMSHELRTPLNAVLGFAQLLAMDDLDRDQRDGVEHILKGGRHLLALVNEVLDLARIESGRFTLSIERVDTSAVVDEAVRLMQPIAAERGVSLRVEDQNQRDLAVSADHQRLKQIIINLLSNAIKYNRAGGAVTIDCDQVSTDEVRIQVHDTGEGIPQHQVGRLFSPFERLDGDQTVIEGSGLGLALSRGLAQAMKGSLRLERSDATGSTFAVRLPKAPVRERAHADLTQAPSVSAPPDLSDITMLYIEDNLANLTLVEELLRRADGRPPLTAVQGSLGLELAAVHQPDLILLDRHLPDMRGDEVLAHLRADSHTAHIPVIVITADAMSERTRTMSSAAAFLTKPIDVEQFWQAVGSALTPTKGQT